jgi:putative flavoprotein involved in K+ transport
MRRTTCLIIGAGQAGLAMSRHLTTLAIDHVLIERGQVANSWRTERWDSLRLLTPNWQSRLPGYHYSGDAPHGFRTMAQTIDFLDDYARDIAAPVETETSVTSVEPLDTGYRVRTGQGDWSCRTLVLASGACNIASTPRLAQELSAAIVSMTPMEYRNPDQLPRGGVLVVGASASGVQIAQELQRSGRPVTLAVGEHVRVPRSYRGADIQWWMDVCGILDRRIDQVDDMRRARSVPSLQLIGGDAHDTIDLNSLQALGVTIAGRAMAAVDARVQFSGGLANACALADLKLHRLLDEIDHWIEVMGLGGSAGPAWRPEPTAVPSDPLLTLDLHAAGIRTVIWATGYRPDYRWLHVPVLTPRGELRHDRGVVDAPGLYALGLPFLRTRKSSLIDGVGDDAEALAGHLSRFLAAGALAA